MAAPILDKEQRDTLLGWLAADYSTGLIRNWAEERGWPELLDSTLSYYRKECRREITALRKRRRSSALNTGLALMEERVARLSRHADELDAIKWIPDDHGKLPNEKAWRETLDDIAKEVGGRVVKKETSGPGGGPKIVKVVVEYPDETVSTEPSRIARQVPIVQVEEDYTDTDQDADTDTDQETEAETDTYESSRDYDR